MSNYNRVQILLQGVICSLAVSTSLDLTPLLWLLVSVLVSQVLAIMEVYQAFRVNGAVKSLPSFIQVFARIGVGAILFVYSNVGSAWLITLLAVCWAMADGIRFLYYLDKSNRSLAWARYHFFMVLYPLGMSMENIIIWYVLAAYMSNPLLVFAPFVLIYITLAIKMFRHMLAQRQRFLRQYQH